MKGEKVEVSPYFIIDLPGQVELYTNHCSLKSILLTLQRELDFRPVICHLTDASCLADTGKYLSASVLAMTSAFQTELPFVSVLSKINLLSCFVPLKFRLSYYCQCFNLDHLLRAEEVAEEA